MGKDSSLARHSLPTCKIDYGTLVPEFTSVEEAEDFRAHVMSLSDDLYDKQIKERFMYGAAAVVWIVAFYWDIAKLSDVAYYLIKIVLDLATAILAIGAYITYQNRTAAESAYWKAVFGPAYRD